MSWDFFLFASMHVFIQHVLSVKALVLYVVFSRYMDPLKPVC